MTTFSSGLSATIRSHLHLLRSGLSLKTIGDLLGHRTLESTCVYLRLAIDDLRDVALPLPAAADRSAPEVAS